LPPDINRYFAPVMVVAVYAVIAFVAGLAAIIWRIV
jgi:hypothetical protein